MPAPISMIPPISLHYSLICPHPSSLLTPHEMIQNFTTQIMTHTGAAPYYSQELYNLLFIPMTILYHDRLANTTISSNVLPVSWLPRTPNFLALLEHYNYDVERIQRINQIVKPTHDQVKRVIKDMLGEGVDCNSEQGSDRFDLLVKELRAWVEELDRIWVGVEEEWRYALGRIVALGDKTRKKMQEVDEKWLE